MSERFSAKEVREMIGVIPPHGPIGSVAIYFANRAMRQADAEQTIPASDSNVIADLPSTIPVTDKDPTK